MPNLLSYIKTPARTLALLFLVVFPFSTVFIYSERFINGYKWEYGTLAYYGIELLGWAFILSLIIPLAKKARGATVRITVDRVFLGAILMFFLYSIVSAGWAVDSALAQQQTLRAMLFLLLSISLPMVLTKKEIITAFSIGAVLPMGIGLYQLFAQDLFSSVWLGISGREVAEAGVSIVQSGEGRWLRAYGTFAHPNIFGGYVAVMSTSMLFGLGQAVSSRLRLWYVCMLLLSGVTLVFTMSRSAWIAALFGGIAVVGVLWQRLGAAQRQAVTSGCVAFGVGVVFACLVTAPLLSVRFGGSVPHEVTSVTERFDLQAQAMEVFRDHPLVGVGAGNMTAARIMLDPARPGYVYQPVHNVVLLLVVEYGLVGVLLLGIVGYSAVRWAVVQGDWSPAFAGMTAFIPLLVLDHYLWTSVHGLGIMAVYLAILLYPNNSSRGA